MKVSRSLSGAVVLLVLVLVTSLGTANAKESAPLQLDPDHAAFLVLHYQNDIVAPGGKLTPLYAERMKQARNIENTKAVLEAARRLHAEGRPVALAGLLLEIPDPALQSLLVAVDDASSDRGTTDPTERLHHLEDALRRRSAQRQAHASAQALKSSRLDPSSEAALLEQLVSQRRAIQGMTDSEGGMTEPKDG